ncbi:MAG: histidinol dehydrogenase [Euryarchaeota archaeon]|nr:histidinol dehydrogenase [Euryarchaeota archaeon]
MVRTEGPALRLEVRRLSGLDPEERKQILERAVGEDADLRARVRDILDDVRVRGDDALRALSARFDGVVPERLVLGPEEMEEAWGALDAPLKAVLERAARNLARVAEGTMPLDEEVEVEPGLLVTQRFRPLRRIGCYVPGGKAAYPSSVLMTAVPARAAGVDEVVVATPPGPDGRPPLEVLAACRLAQVDEVLVSGGAQAIGALAYGTGSVAAVEKIVGPGNRYVTEAKRAVFGRVGIDSPAGPTEVLVLADASADPTWVALDLIAQAEHAEDARCVLVTPDARFAEAVAARIPALLDDHPRAAIAGRALSDHGLLLVSDDVDSACAFAADYAPEHLQIMTETPDLWSEAVPTAGTTFIGHHAPVAVGDYLTGADHVLPTAGAARWAEPLSAHDFLRRTTEQRLTPDAARALIDDLALFARSEGLEGHARSMEARRGKTQEGGV